MAQHIAGSFSRKAIEDALTSQNSKHILPIGYLTSLKVILIMNILQKKFENNLHIWSHMENILG